MVQRSMGSGKWTVLDLSGYMVKAWIMSTNSYATFHHSALPRQRNYFALTSHYGDGISKNRFNDRKTDIFRETQAGFIAAVCNLQP